MAKQKSQPAAQAGNLFQSSAPEVKEKTDRVAEWQNNGQRMVAWFNDLKQLPPEPIKINKWSTIIDVKKYVETQICRVENNITNPYNRVFQTSYLRLYELKKFIESE